MKYGYLIAYSDNNGHGFEDKQPWIHPSNPMRKKDIEREMKFMENVVKPSIAIPFRVEFNNVPQDIDWDFVYNNEVKLE